MKNNRQGDDKPQNSDTLFSNSRLLLEDVLIYGFCVAGILFFLNAFRIDLFKTLTRQAENPIGIITFKYKAAHRRFVDRVLWDRLRKESPVYNGDFIRTAELSEATVTLEGGRAILNLSENSLIQLRNNHGNIRVNINEGGIGAHAENSALVLVAGDSLVALETGAVVKAGLDGGDLMLRVMEGAVSFAGPGGAGSVSAGETVALNEAGPQPVREAAALFPRPQARFLSPRPGKFAVPFHWNRANLSPEAVTRLEIAEDSAFSRIVFSREFSDDAVSVELEPGSYFWRVAPVGDERAGRHPNILSFKIIFAPAPALITPVEGYRYQFRVKRPSVRFQWMETEEAAFYILEVADNPEMANPALSREVRGTSFYFPDLGPGTWHWRARPVFPAGYEGAVGEGIPASFAIVQSADLGTPELLSPQDRGLVNLATDRGNVYFSWRPKAEASSYRIKISANQDLDAPVIDATTQDNFYVCRPGRNALAPGQYYWAVLQTDIEGNDSALSPKRSFVVLEGEAIQHLVFPPDGYVVEASMLPDTRFSWRTNLPFQTQFQISRDQDFSSPFIDETASGTTFQGRILSEGTWHWRIQSRGSGGAGFETPRRSFVVARPVAAPLLLEPAQDQRLLIQEGEPLVFSWTASDGAEYYQFTVRYEGSRNSPVYENSLVKGTQGILSMDGRPEGNYHWTVRGFAPESPRNGRRMGLLAEGVFSVRMLRPARLDHPGNDRALPLPLLPRPLLPRPAGRLPEDGKVIDAAELRANRRIVFSWDAVTGATGYLFVLENALTGATIMQQGPVAETALSLEDLPLLDVGPFVWRVEAVAAEPEGEAPGDPGTMLQRGEISENRFTIDFSLPGIPVPRKPGIFYGKE